LKVSKVLEGEQNAHGRGRGTTQPATYSEAARGRAGVLTEHYSVVTVVESIGLLQAAAAEYSQPGPISNGTLTGEAFADLPALASVGSTVPRLPAGEGRVRLMDVTLSRRSVLRAQKLKAW
jgi:hypothetical protein